MLPLHHRSIFKERILYCTPSRSQTCDLQIRRLLLCSTELSEQFAGPNRLEQFLSVLETDVLPLTLKTRKKCSPKGARTLISGLRGRLPNLLADRTVKIVLPQGLEPRTLSLRGISSNQLSYKSVVLVINFHYLNITERTRTSTSPAFNSRPPLPICVQLLNNFRRQSDLRTRTTIL